MTNIDWFGLLTQSVLAPVSVQVHMIIFLLKTDSSVDFHYRLITFTKGRSSYTQINQRKKKKKFENKVTLQRNWKKKTNSKGIWPLQTCVFRSFSRAFWIVISKWKVDWKLFGFLFEYFPGNGDEAYKRAL